MKAVWSSRRGFTLIELLLSIGIIAALAAIVIAAINPSRQLAQARNAQRRSDVRSLLDALQQYGIDNRSVVAAGVDMVLRMVGTATSGCAVLCLGTQGAATDIPPTGIGALWHLDESSGTIMDSSGNGRNSTVVSGVTYGVAGRFGTTLHFDGNDYVDFATVFPHDSDPKASINELTAEAWFRASAPPLTTGVIAWEGWGGSFVLQMNTAGGVGFVVKQTTAGGTNYDGAWHHIAGRYHRTENTLRLYVDGLLRGTNTGMSPSEYLSDPPTTHPPILGASSVWTGARQQFFIGDIDEVALYNRALSDAEILERYQRGEATADACLDLTPFLVNRYLPVVPADPRYGNSAKTYYAVTLGADNRVEVRACSAELGEDIVVTR